MSAQGSIKCLCLRTSETVNAAEGREAEDKGRGNMRSKVGARCSFVSRSCGAAWTPARLEASESAGRTIACLVKHGSAPLSEGEGAYCTRQMRKTNLRVNMAVVPRQGRGVGRLPTAERAPGEAAPWEGSRKARECLEGWDG